MNFGQQIDVDHPKGYLEDQVHRSRSPGQKNISGLIWPSYRLILRSRATWVKVKGHTGQGQSSTFKVKVKNQGHHVI